MLVIALYLLMTIPIMGTNESRAFLSAPRKNKHERTMRCKTMNSRELCDRGNAHQIIPSRYGGSAGLIMLLMGIVITHATICFLCLIRSCVFRKNLVHSRSGWAGLYVDFIFVSFHMYDYMNKFKNDKSNMVMAFVRIGMLFVLLLIIVGMLLEMS